MHIYYYIHIINIYIYIERKKQRDKGSKSAKFMPGVTLKETSLKTSFFQEQGNLIRKMDASTKVGCKQQLKRRRCLCC